MSHPQRKKRRPKVNRGTPTEEAAVKIALTAVGQGWSDVAANTMLAAFSEVRAGTPQDWAPQRKRWSFVPRFAEHQQVDEDIVAPVWVAELVDAELVDA